MLMDAKQQKNMIFHNKLISDMSTKQPYIITFKLNTKVLK